MKLQTIITVVCVLVATAIGSGSAVAQQKRAFMVGISDYGNSNEDPNKWSNISGANDVTLLTPELQSQGFTVQSLTDSKATYKAIKQGLNDLTKKCKKGDTVYLHFSMHGQPIEDKNGDETDGWDEALIPYDAQLKFKKGSYEGQNHLLDDELEAYFNKIRSKIGSQGHLYVIMDACHSGTASRGEGDHVRGVRDGFTSDPNKLYKPDRTQETNGYYKLPTVSGQSPVTFLEACRSYQQNKEVLEKNTKTWYGSLSYYVCQASKSNQIGSQSWLEAVKTGMKGNRWLRKQNMVIEISK